MRVHAAVALLGAALLAGPLPAHADESGLTTPTLSITLASVTEGVTFCMHGTAEEVGPWAVHVAGARATPYPFLAQISYDWVSPGATSFDWCYGQTRMGTPAGQFDITFAYLGGTGSTGVARPTSIHAAVWWTAGGPDQWSVTPQV